MRILIILMLVIAVPSVVMFSGCDRDKEVPEENLRVTTDAVNNSEIPGATYDFNLTVESVMPRNGVGISINVVGESDNRNYSPVPDIETFNKTTTIHLSGLPLQQYSLVGIRVTSKTKNTNTVTLSFRVIRK
ncbi:MAG TPA: hypothetical protein VJ765_01740 [Chitinophagaceae bacterium]|nr:hypothetical protein [Chitinophagaceae bacterium]